VPVCYITRKEHFNAAHRLFCKEWTDEQNNEIFGKCANPNGHGHNFLLLVTIKGSPDKDTGFVTNLKELSKTIKEVIIDKVDHTNLNTDVDFLKGINPSIENMSIAFWKELSAHLPSGSLHCIELFETDNNSVKYHGEE
jgi:6-pyruvoyltetrahydropterin/6-carboxytetrahydropterin synthase